jgi:RecB family exonuclease
MQLEHLSASRIETFEQCEMKYHAHYELGLRIAPHPLAVMGSAVHVTAEQVSNEMRDNRQVPFDEQKALLLSTCAMLGVEHAQLQTAVNLYENLVQWGYYREIGKSIGIELEHDGVLPDGTKYVAKIDRLDDYGDWLDIIDIKTQQQQFEQDELLRRWQSRIYDLAVIEMCGNRKGRNRVSYWVVRHMVQRTMIEKDEHLGTKLDMMKVADRIRNCNAPRTTVSALCPWCPYYSQCEDAKGSVRSRLARRSRAVK